MTEEDKKFEVLKRSFLNAFDEARNSASALNELRESIKHNPVEGKLKFKLAIGSCIKFFAAGECLFKYMNEPGWKNFKEKKIKTSRIFLLIDHMQKIDDHIILICWIKLREYISEMILPLNYESMFRSAGQKDFSVN